MMSRSAADVMVLLNWEPSRVVELSIVEGTDPPVADSEMPRCRIPEPNICQIEKKMQNTNSSKIYQIFAKLQNMKCCNC